MLSNTANLLSRGLARASSARAPSSSILRHFSTAPNTNVEAVHRLQKQKWNTYLANGRGSDDLFASIDTDDSKAINVEELHFFLDSVDHKGVHPRAFQMLDEIAHDHQITLKEFKSWLVLATKMESEKKRTFTNSYQNHPQLGQMSQKQPANEKITTAGTKSP